MPNNFHATTVSPSKEAQKQKKAQRQKKNKHKKQKTYLRAF